jgi:hypothetical protein
MLDSLSDILTDEGFRTGALCGAVAAVALALAGLVSRRRLPAAGLAFGAASIVALADRYTVPGRLVVGLIVLAAGAAAGDRWAPPGPAGLVVRILGAVPGALVVGDAAATDRPGWALPVVATAAVVGGALVAACDRAHASEGATPVMLAITVFGVYVTTPDTEHAAVVLGAAVPVALLGWPWPVARLGAAGSFVATAVIAWVVVLDGVGRDGAVVGALACLGALAVEPVARWIAGHRPPTPGPAAAPGPATARAANGLWRLDLPLVGVHVALVAVCARLAGLRSSAAAAAAISAVAWLAGAVVLARLARRAPADSPASARRSAG